MTLGKNGAGQRRQLPGLCQGRCTQSTGPRPVLLRARPTLSPEEVKKKKKEWRDQALHFPSFAFFESFFFTRFNGHTRDQPCMALLGTLGAAMTSLAYAADGKPKKTGNPICPSSGWNLELDFRRS